MALPTIPGQPTVNAKWRVDVNTAFDPNASSQSAATWVQVKGANSVAPKLDTTVQDATDNDTAGWGADAPTGRKWGIDLTVLRKTYSNAYDPGQEKLRAAAKNLTLVHVRYYERGVPGGEAYEGLALVQWAPQGGDPTGLSSVQVTVMGQGANSEITSPDSVWQVAKTYNLNDVITLGAGTVKATVAGTSGATAPTLPGAVGGTVTDNTVTWTRLT